jgi:putative phosphoesterase
MRILLLADIHSNWPALAAIREPFDACLVLGDLVDYATDPVPCIEWVRANADASIRGNHDHAVAQRVAPRAGTGFRGLVAATRPVHWELLSRLHMHFLARMPVTRNLSIGDHAFHLVHATPRDPMDEYLTGNPEAWELRLRTIQADFVCVGHTHLPFHIRLNRTQVINPGSVGQPRDGDPRAAYAVIDNGRVELRRVSYDIDATLRQMEDVGIDRDVIERTEGVLRSGGELRNDPPPSTTEIELADF